ncbi:hypothetical protein AURDEDRAFT_131606 [Auricularia subglabra TFB-10046 SS5]|uniref:Uncharacterized protein n=1 Tax=Auricularia subglabra (strain TFB-10046 / SS5) TaxID=717982 RepID=J0CTG0_AURST|nr:hypothetical protein AURDEDRAFT_131606 [Auricularia subglabra TFB-10046 SS5]
MPPRAPTRPRKLTRTASTSTADDTELGYSNDDELEEEVPPSRKRRREDVEVEMPPPSRPAPAREALKECKSMSSKLDKLMQSAMTHSDFRDLRELLLGIQNDVSALGKRGDVTHNGGDASHSSSGCGAKTSGTESLALDLKKLRKDLASSKDESIRANTKVEKLAYECRALEGQVADYSKKIEDLQADIEVHQAVLGVYQSLTNVNIAPETADNLSVFSCEFTPVWSASMNELLAHDSEELQFALEIVKKNKRAQGWKYKPVVDSATGPAFSSELDEFLKDMDIEPEALSTFFLFMLDKSTPRNESL